jgi:hypothetical protein
MANDKEMHPLSGDIVETTGVYQDRNGREIELKAGDEYPMDPQEGQVEWRMVGFLLNNEPGKMESDRAAAEVANVPISAVNVEEEEATQSRQLSHRRHGGDR